VNAIRHPHPEPPAPGEAAEVAPGILWMRLPLPGALDHVNTYALSDDDGWTVVDTGMASNRSRAVWEALLAGPLAGTPMARVLVTHHHPDHIGLAGWFRSRGADLITTRTAWLYARMLTLDVQAVPAPESVAFWRMAGMDPAILAARLAERPFNFADVVAPLPLGFTRITDGARLHLAGRGWTVRTGGGHAPEQATLWSDDGIILGADQLLPGISPNIGVYPTEPMADPLADWLDTCRRFQPLARPDHLVLPGHKLPFTGLPLRLTQMIENHEGALDRILTTLQGAPRTACACFPAIFRRSIAPGEYGLAMVEAVAHLNHLAARGAVTRGPGPDGATLWHAA
jgi:glyoxylase-like metal-dependent hydrolase (beta-lactamase superfamily II)